MTEGARTDEIARSTGTRYADLPLASPAAHSGLIDVFRRRYLLRLLVRRELTARYSGSVLGMLWSYVNPLSQLFIYWFVMGKIMGMASRTDHFALHVFVALITVHFFTETFNAGTRSIVRNKALVRKMALPTEMFPVASMLVSAANVFPQVVVLLVICFFSGWMPDAEGVVAGVLGMAIMATIGTALALVFSVANVFFRDFGQLVNILTNFVRFSVPMMYPFTIVAERFGNVEAYLANPLAVSVLLMQRCFWAGTTKNVEFTLHNHFPHHLLMRGGIALLFGVAMVLVAQLIFSRLHNKIAERV
jgi:ABC-2 type transport system permease protein